MEWINTLSFGKLVMILFAPAATILVWKAMEIWKLWISDKNRKAIERQKNETNNKLIDTMKTFEKEKHSLKEELKNHYDHKITKLVNDKWDTSISDRIQKLEDKMNNPPK